MVDANEKIPLCNGEFELFRIKPDAADEIVEFYFNNFLKIEPTHKIADLFGCELFREKSAKRLRECLQDEVSFAVRHCATKKLAAIRINRIVKSTTPPDPQVKPTTSALVYVADFEKRVKEAFNVFEEWNVDCVLEFLGLATHSEFGGRGFGTKLSQYSVEFASAMLNGNLKGRESLPAHVRDLKPKAVVGIFSSKFTQKIAEKIGMETLAKIPYTDLFFEDKPISELLEPIHNCVTCVAKKL